jgi:hypothetical protein
MRHESVETTLRYYVGRDADATADALYAAFETSNSHKTGNIDADSNSESAKEKSQTLVS